MRRWQRSPWQAHRGQAIVEFTLILVMLMVLGAAAWEFGRILEAQIVATNAAREGARYASVNTLDSNLVSKVQDHVVEALTTGYGNRVGKLQSNGSCTGGDVCFQALSEPYTPSNGVYPTSCASDNDVCVYFTPSPAIGNSVSIQLTVHVNVYAPFVPGLQTPYSIKALATMQLE